MATKQLPPLGTLERFQIDFCTACKFVDKKLIGSGKPCCTHARPDIYKGECLTKGAKK